MHNLPAIPETVSTQYAKIPEIDDQLGGAVLREAQALWDERNFKNRDSMRFTPSIASWLNVVAYY